MLTPSQRLLAAAKKQPLDRPPCICPGGMMNMMFQDIMVSSGCSWPQAHWDAATMAGLASALVEAGGFENYGVPFCMTVEAEGLGAQVNLGDLLVEPHVTQPLLASVEQIGKLAPFDPQQGRAKVVLDAISLLKQQQAGVPIIGNLTGPVSLAGTLVDMATLLKEYHKKPSASHAFMAAVAQASIAFGKAQLAAGADAICISEPSGTGEILGPDFFRAYTVRYINQVLDAISAPIAIVHICGRLQSVYQVLPELHCDVFSFDSIVPLSEMKTVLPQKAVMGNVSTHAIGTMPAPRVAHLALTCQKKGADVIAPACGLPTITPLKNVQAMVNAIKFSTEVC